MIWNDILLERIASAEELRSAVRAAGLVRIENENKIVESMEDVDLESRIKAVCECTVRKGQFPLQVGVYPYGSLPLDVHACVARFAQSVGCRCLIPADSADPYRVIDTRPLE